MLHLVLEHDPAAEDQRGLEQGFLGAQAERGAALAGLAAHAAPRLRLRPGRPGRGHPADPGLPRPPQHPAPVSYTHLDVYKRQR